MDKELINNKIFINKDYFLETYYIDKLKREPNFFISFTIYQALDYIYHNKFYRIKNFKSLIPIVIKIYRQVKESIEKDIIENERILKSININEIDKKFIDIKYTDHKYINDKIDEFIEKDINKPDKTNDLERYDYYSFFKIKNKISLYGVEEKIKEAKEFKYSGDDERKRADRLTIEGFNIISKKLREIKTLINENKENINDKNELSKDDDFKDINFKNKTAKDTELTKYEPSNLKMINTLLTFFVKKPLSNKDYFKKEELTNKIEKLKEKLKDPILNNNDRKTIKTEIELTQENLKGLNIVRIKTLNDNENIDDDFKITNIENNGDINIFNKDNLIITYFKNYNISISQHHNEFYYTNATTKKLLNEIIKKAYRENKGEFKSNIIYFDRVDLIDIYSNIREKDIIAEFKKDIDRLKDFTISSTYKDITGDIIHIDKGILDKPSYYDLTNKKAVIYVNIDFLKWIFRSGYHNTPKEIDTKKVKANFIAPLESILSTPKGTKYKATTLNEILGGESLEYYKIKKKSLNRFWGNINDFTYFLSGFKNFKIEKNYKNESNKIKDIKKAEITIKKRHIAEN